MSETAAKLLDQILALPHEEQVWIAAALWGHLGNESVTDETDDPEFYAELERRLASVADGTARLLPVDEALAEVEAELDRRRVARQRTGT